MKQLVIKDMRLLKIINLVILCGGILFGYIGVSIDHIYKSKLVYGFAMFIMVYIVSMFSTQYDVKGKTDMMLNSFPVDRYDIVKSKYISMGLYILFITGVVFLSSNISRIIFSTTISGNPATIWDVSFIIGLSLVFFSIYLPFHYYNVGKAQAFNQIFYIILIILPNVISKFSKKIENTEIFQGIINMDWKIVILMFVSIGAIMYLISLQISKNIYKGKEF
ncbi:ABC-2 transporter permease [Tissierella pigra]|uniref:ABC-2 transporter permease n=1 Tax=Tissierella pigra TaxID=2607614 RepID=A0A6N7XZS0_9FIRM|nr:ABC-2 transporter permease [Tissierella pigra]MBU5425267.1 ABC-2 transporter permease [Tissierella pigra]MSU02094.1 ABC-2 transporter permease [Tissierella pigra]